MQSRPYPVEAPDNVDTIPGWVWALAAGTVVSCGLAGVLGAVGAYVLSNTSDRTGVLALCCAGVFGLAGLLMAIRAVPLLLLAAQQAGRRRK